MVPRDRGRLSGQYGTSGCLGVDRLARLAAALCPAGAVDFDDGQAGGLQSAGQLVAVASGARDTSRARLTKPAAPGEQLG